MTALYMAVGETGIVMMTDGAAYDHDGVVRQIHQKQLVRSDINTVAAASGSGAFTVILDVLCAQYSPQSFDDFHRLMPGMMRLALRNMDHARRTELLGRPKLQDEDKCYSFVLYGGYSDEHQKFMGYAISSYPVEFMKLEPFEAGRFSLVTKPNPTREAMDRAGMGTDALADIAREGGAIYGARFMLAARRSPYELHGPGSHEGYGVGGFVQHTFLERDQVSTSILWRWPDEIGRRIEPDNDPEITIGSPSILDEPREEAVTA